MPLLKSRNVATGHNGSGGTSAAGSSAGELTSLYQIVSAEETVSSHTVTYDLQRAASGVLAGFYMANETPNHYAASDEQKARGDWHAAEDGTLGDGSAGYDWQ